MNVKLLSKLDFAAKLNSVEAVTESGRDFLKNYRGYMYNNASSCGIVNGFISEARNYSYDTGVISILESVLKFVTDNNISWKLASACESVVNNNSPYNYIAKVGVSQVEKLLEMDESDIIQYIKGGCLKNVQYIPEFRRVCKEVFQSTMVNENVNKTDYIMRTPVSYVLLEGEAQYFAILGSVYRISEGIVEKIDAVEDYTFNRINSLLPNFKFVDEALVYEYKPSRVSDTYKFTIKEGEVKFEKNKINETFESVTEFKQYMDGFSRQLFTSERNNFMNICNSIAEVFEAIENIVLIDCAKVMESTNSSVVTIVEAKDNINVTIVRSVGYGTSSKSFDYMAEAADEIKKITGNDVKSVFSDRIDEDIKKRKPRAYEEIKEQLNAAKDEQIAFRRRKISLLAEQFKNDPVKIALLNNIAKELSILED